MSLTDRGYPLLDFLNALKLNQVTEIGTFVVRTKLASEFEFPAPILQGRTVGKENKFKKIVYSQLYEQILKILVRCARSEN